MRWGGERNKNQKGIKAGGEDASEQRVVKRDRHRHATAPLKRGNNMVKYVQGPHAYCPLESPSGSKNDQNISKVPAITLDSQEISAGMAARLTTALLGQLLYLKGQIPFPGTASRNAAQAAKKKAEFLDAYDDLTSHLRTTFTALSTALAQNTVFHPVILCSEPSLMLASRPTRRPAKIHILLLLGPSLSMAKARVLLEVDGLRVERFGEWEFMSRHPRNSAADHKAVNEDADNAIQQSSAASAWPELREPPSTPSPRRSPSHGGSSWNTPKTSSSDEDELEVSSPSSTPPSPSESSTASSLETSSSDSENGAEERNLNSPVRHSPQFNLNGVSSYVEEEESLRKGERLLSRAVFSGEEGLNLGDEIPITQAHILIKAPRRFSHPTWIPRQNLSDMFDRQVEAFLKSEGQLGNESVPSTRRGAGFGSGVRTIGLRVKCQSKVNVELSGNDGEGERSDEEGLDDAIWWSWDGKLVGFSE
ncbi:hypothetical protein BU17DRAFT_64361 [Hysterangium stoloniferum]|nr:hypothetical protein BU17DRAFT_64361 [Hysterangium stoloniferum]